MCKKKTFLNYIKNIPHHKETNISHNVDFDFLYNRINICAWRQAFMCHQARLSQVSEHVKIHSLYTHKSVSGNMCIYNIILNG